MVEGSGDKARVMLSEIVEKRAGAICCRLSGPLALAAMAVEVTFLRSCSSMVTVRFLAEGIGSPGGVADGGFAYRCGSGQQTTIRLPHLRA